MGVETKEDDYKKLRGTHDGENLSRSVVNAKLMLVHASEQGIDISEELTQKIVKAKYLQANNKWTEQDEAEFWHTFKEISKTIQPVTIDSILAANDKTTKPTLTSRIFGKREGMTLTRKAVRRYTRYAVLSLAIMLIVQIYALIGTTVVNNINDQEAQIKKLEQEIILQQRLQSVQKARSLELEKDVVVDKREKNIELLARWLRPIDYLLFNTPADLSDFRLSKSKKKQKVEVYEKINDLAIRVRESAQHPLLIINSYILPLLYGLLGAYAYVLRVLSDEIKTITYSKDSDIKYILRINLGALAGLAVGLLFTPDAEHFVSLNLPPLTLAFVAGYSIEFVFTAVDKFIGGATRLRAKEE